MVESNDKAICRGDLTPDHHGVPWSISLPSPQVVWPNALCDANLQEPRADVIECLYTGNSAKFARAYGKVSALKTSWALG